MNEQYIVACEIGSSKVKGAVGTVDESGTLNVLAVAEEPVLDSVRYGVIRKIEEVSNRLGSVIQKLESSSGVAPRKITGIYVALGGQSLASCVRETETSFAQDTEIDNGMIRDLKERVRAGGVPDREIVAILSREFTVNSLPEKNPVGTFAHDLKAELNVVYCRPQIKRNLAMVIEERLGLKVNGYIVRPLAQADMVLTEDEKHLGAMLVDFGAETTTVSIYKNGVLRYLATIPMGSRNITRDITATNIIEKRAEEIKKTVGNVEPQPENVSFDSLDNTEVNKYVSARVAEIITNIIEQLSFAGISGDELPGGIVVVGLGAKLKGFNSLLSLHSKMKVRQGTIAPAIRLTDSSIPYYESVDVVSILSFATRFPEKECVIMPEPQPAEEDNPGDDGGDDINVSRIGSDFGSIESDDDAVKDPHVRSGSGTKSPHTPLITRLRDKLFDMLNDKSDGDDDTDEQKN